MLEKVFDLYFKEYSIKRFFSFFNYIIFVLICILSVCTLIYFIIQDNPAMFTITLVISTSIFILYLNYLSKKILKKHYAIKSPKFLANMSSYNRAKYDKLEIFLRKNEILQNDDKILLLINSVNERIEKLKVPSILKNSTLLALLIPIWGSYVQQIFKTASTLEEATLLFFLLIGIVLYLFFIFYQLKSLFNDLTNTKLNKYKKLHDDLKNIYFDFKVS